MLGRTGSEGVREGFREQSWKGCCVHVHVEKGCCGLRFDTPNLNHGFVLIILSGLLRIWGLRSEICRLVPLQYVHYY